MVRFDDGPVCVFITGCTRGLGKGIALVLAAELQAGSVVVLLGRSSSRLEDTRAEMLKSNSKLDVKVNSSYDCSQLDPAEFSAMVDTVELPCNIDQLLVIHNAATFGDATKKSFELDATEVEDYVKTNFISAVTTNTIIMRRFSCMLRTVVNITANPLVSNFSGTAIYSAGKC